MRSFYIGMIVFVIIFYASLIGYLVFAYKKDYWPFDKYERKSGPAGTSVFEPNARPYTQAEIEKRQELIDAARAHEKAN